MKGNNLSSVQIQNSSPWLLHNSCKIHSLSFPSLYPPSYVCTLYRHSRRQNCKLPQTMRQKDKVAMGSIDYINSDVEWIMLVLIQTQLHIPKLSTPGPTSNSKYPFSFPFPFQSLKSLFGITHPPLHHLITVPVVDFFSFKASSSCLSY